MSVNAHDLEKISKILPPWESFLRLNGATFSKRMPSIPFTLTDQRWKTAQEAPSWSLGTGLRSTMSNSRLNNEATVFHAELHAIELAINYIVKNNLEEDIITDSRSTLLALANPRNYEPNILSLKDGIKNFQHNINFKWAKAHIGILGNEAADTYAKWPPLKTTLTTLLNYKKDTSKLFFVPAQFFNKDPKRACGHVIEDRLHLIYQCSKWRKIRQKYFPANFSNIALPQLLQSNSVRSGLETILKQRLEESLSATEDNLQ
ncbi:hypothetical protein CEXT_364941 [Caerostris extrusa]|uniref:RNase H type-1 domain-containing protein n=1 Tax=Caerostris extrusa TaxID=172846 RepID=A0AAV4QSK7_CAEEX|nr:hypothetical protein CEXT_364941 [Caerostris extrusa]